MTTKEVTVRIRTWGEGGRLIYREYIIPVEGEMNVLNALEYVHEVLDPTISYRSSCRRGVCGACLMTIDGKKRLACETLLAEGMEIDPSKGE